MFKIIASLSLILNVFSSLAMATDDRAASLAHATVIENTGLISNLFKSTVRPTPSEVEVIKDRDISGCQAEIGSNQLQGACSVFITSKYEITPDRLKIYTSEQVDVAKKTVIEIQTPAYNDKKAQRKFFVVKRAVYNVHVSLDGTQREPDFSISELPN